MASERWVLIFSAATPKGGEINHGTRDHVTTLCGREVYGRVPDLWDPDSAYTCRRCLAAAHKLEEATDDR